MIARNRKVLLCLTASCLLIAPKVKSIYEGDVIYLDRRADLLAKRAEPNKITAKQARKFEAEKDKLEAEERETSRRRLNDGVADGAHRKAELEAIRLLRNQEGYDWNRKD